MAWPYWRSYILLQHFPSQCDIQEFVKHIVDIKKLVINLPAQKQSPTNGQIDHFN